MPADALKGRTLVLAGPGRAGRAFARSWRRAGGRIAGIVTRSDPPPTDPALAGAAAASWADGSDLPESDVIALAVSDDAIAEAAARLAPRSRARFAYHFSGALSSALLSPFAAGPRRASIASLHPVRPFTGSDHEDWAGAFVAVEGEEDASREGEDILRALGARPYRIAEERKPLYHAAASLAAGGVAAVLSVAVRAWEEAGIPDGVARETLSALAAGAAEAVGRRPFADAFTGAVARRDSGTVRVHTESLSRDADALSLYASLAEEILRRTEGRGREDEIRAILGRNPAPK
ncbi:MAG TPA: DUF2520 domain-containing protein [Thermoanaerobaculia bacterium]|nr:DUF2520 domain-containing protein [Thermoanaerobaculia bacterium]